MRVRLFAGLAEAAGTHDVEVEWEGGTAAELLERLAISCPELANRLAACRVAADAEFVRLEDRIDRAREVAVIPPVAGGAR